MILANILRASGIFENFMTQAPLKFEVFRLSKEHNQYSRHCGEYKVETSVNQVVINLLKIPIPVVFLYNKFCHLWAIFDLF